MKKLLSALSIFALSATLPTVASAETAYIVTKHDGYVYMRNAPQASAKKILKLRDYTPVRVLSCGSHVQRLDYAAYGDIGSWCKVAYGKKVGYVFSAYLDW